MPKDQSPCYPKNCSVAVAAVVVGKVALVPVLAHPKLLDPSASFPIRLLVVKAPESVQSVEVERRK